MNPGEAPLRPLFHSCARRPPARSRHESSCAPGRRKARCQPGSPALSVKPDRSSRRTRVSETSSGRQASASYPEAAANRAHASTRLAPMPSRLAPGSTNSDATRAVPRGMLINTIAPTPAPSCSAIQHALRCGSGAVRNSTTMLAARLPRARCVAELPAASSAWRCTIQPKSPARGPRRRILPMPSRGESSRLTCPIEVSTRRRHGWSRSGSSGSPSMWQQLGDVFGSMGG
jgi:hypothetical protein